MISSKIRLQGGGWLTVTLDTDLVYIGDMEFDFVLAVINHLREFVRTREQTEAGIEP